jgi:hypothetical protein
MKEFPNRFRHKKGFYGEGVVIYVNSVVVTISVPLLSFFRQTLMCILKQAMDQRKAKVSK